MPLLLRLSRRRWSNGLARSAEFAGHPAGGLADVDERAPALLHQRGRTLVEALGELVNCLHLLKQLIGLTVGEARHDIVDPGEDIVDAGEGSVSLCQHAVDRLALALQ